MSRIDQDRLVQPHVDDVAGYGDPFVPAKAGTQFFSRNERNLILVRRHGDPDRRFSGKAHAFQHDLVGNVERLEIDVVIVLAL